MRDLDKKKKEKIVLEKFISIYKDKIKNDVKSKILDEKCAKTYFSKYNGENPDFIIEFDNRFIGAELFRLVGNELNSLNLNNNEQELNIKNIAHLNDRREKAKDPSLFLIEDLPIVAVQRINEKIEYKLRYYINCPIWLIGYASENYNCFLLRQYFDDGIEDEISKNIRKKITNNNRIERIWLIELSAEPLLLQIK